MTNWNKKQLKYWIKNHAKCRTTKKSKTKFRILSVNSFPESGLPLGGARSANTPAITTKTPITPLNNVSSMRIFDSAPI